jgi:hypothetical protein
MAKRKICPCGVKSVPGLKAGVALCQKHFSALFYAPIGTPEYKEAKWMLVQQEGWDYCSPKTRQTKHNQLSY